MAIFNSKLLVYQRVSDVTPDLWSFRLVEPNVMWLAMWRTRCTVKKHTELQRRRQAIHRIIGVLYETSLQNHCWRTKLPNRKRQPSVHGKHARTISFQ